MVHKNTQDDFLAALNAHKGILYKVSNVYCAQPEERHDLVQEIIVELWRAYSGFDATRAQFSTWMYRIALNVAISLHRGQSRRIQDALPLEANLLDFAAADLELAKNNDDLLALKQLLASLDALSRALILLYLEGYEQNEIAEFTGLTPSNVGTRLQRIKQKLQQQASACAEEKHTNPRGEL
jgi:RNA polymerase sigma factor (sigma-70 family)